MCFGVKYGLLVFVTYFVMECVSVFRENKTVYFMCAQDTQTVASSSSLSLSLSGLAKKQSASIFHNTTPTH